MGYKRLSKKNKLGTHVVNHLKELKKKIQNIIHFSVLKNVFTYEQFFIEYSIDSYTCVCNMNFFFFLFAKHFK